MTEALWASVDAYISDRLQRQDEALAAALRDSDAAGLPAINVSPNHGKFLHLLARMIGARRILEIGTLGGYSAIWLARALPPDGRLITLEYEPKHAEVARANWQRAGVSDRIEVRIGKALDLLPGIESERLGPFDLFFIDADKLNNPKYFGWALRLSRLGSVIVVDNVVRKGGILDPASEDDAVRGTRQLYERVGNEPRVQATVIQTVGTKGYDGMLVALVVPGPAA
jgi:predicted O-methyltransferase YrrM